MTQASITSLDSFRLRSQHSEQWRTALMLAALVVQTSIIVLRRALGGAVMSENRLFWTALALIGGLAIYELAMLRVIRKANRDGRILPDSIWLIGAALELVIPLGFLALQQTSLREGHVQAAIAPAMLILPIVIVLSILRLKPGFTLAIGAGAAVGHVVIVSHAIATERPPLAMYPMLMTYPILLMMCGVCAALVAKEAKRHVRESVDETIESEQAQRQLQSVQHDLGIARDIQTGLIPKTPPVVNGFEIAGFNRPADLTGGDYYDWQTLPDGRAVIALADVTGHGIGPALVMAICRAYARAFMPVLPRLHDVVTRLNALICDDVRGQRFITLVVTLIHPRTNSLELLSAGHGPSLLYRATSRTIERFDGDGLPLGIDAAATYDEARTLTLEPGDFLLLMTDGFFEFRRSTDNEQFGIDRISNLIRNLADQDASLLVRLLDEEVRRFSEGAPQTDDMTAAVIKRR